MYKDSFEKMCNAFYEYEEAFMVAFLDIQKDLFGEDKMKFFLEIPFCKDDWRHLALKSFNKLNNEWAMVDLRIEAETYRAWIDEILDGYTSCKCQGSGCNRCLL